MKYLPIISFIALTFLLPLQGQAASLVLEQQGDSLVIVSLEANTQTLNAFSGVLRVSNAKTVHSLSTGNSIAPLWPQLPLKQSDGTTHTIEFSGVILSGFSSVNTFSGKTKPGKLFSFVIEPLDNQEATIELISGQGYLNDGLGTEIDLSGDRLYLSPITVEDDEVEIFIPDILAPQITSVEIIQEKELFDGKPTLIFNTNDNDTGVFSVNLIINEETIENITSPYLLPGFDSEQTLTLRAIDASGNATSTTITYTPEQKIDAESEESDKSGHAILWFSILLLLALLIFFLYRRRDSR